MPLLRIPLSPPKLRECDIRPALIEFVRRRLRKSTIGHGFYQTEVKIGRCRADLTAQFGPHWEGFEIKSETDSLSRLSIQVPTYNLFFDRCWLIAHTKHFPLAWGRIPEWWGAMETYAANGNVILELRRGPQLNPGGVDIKSLLKLMWKRELVKMLLVRGGKPGRKNKWIIRKELERLYTAEELKAFVRKWMGGRLKSSDGR